MTQLIHIKSPQVTRKQRKRRTVRAMSRLLLFYFSLVSFDASGFLVPNGKTTVQSPVGEIVGFTSTATIGGRQGTVRNYLGIPFAEPPVNRARFSKPIPKARFSSPFDASNYGHSCFQFEGRFNAPRNASYSEDCLTLNIFAPEELPGSITLYPGESFRKTICLRGFQLGYS